MSINNKQKYTPDWEKEISRLSLILDGTETDDNKKKSKQLAKLLTERTDLVKEQQEKAASIRKLENHKKELVNVAAYLRAVNKQKDRLKTNKTAHKSRMSNFLGEPFGSTNTTAPTTK